MQKEIHIPREKTVLERTADIASGYIVIACILAMGLLAMACTVQLVRIERQLVVAARV